MKPVTVYLSPTCAYCHMLRKFLTEKGVEYEEVDISRNQEAAQEMVRETGQMSVPVTKIGDDYVIGFAKEIISEKLNLS